MLTSQCLQFDVPVSTFWPPWQAFWISTERPRASQSVPRASRSVPGAAQSLPKRRQFPTKALSVACQNVIFTYLEGVQPKTSQDVARGPKAPPRGSQEATKGPQETFILGDLGPSLRPDNQKMSTRYAQRLPNGQQKCFRWHFKT